MCKNLIMGPAKLMEVSPKGDFKDFITRKRWLGTVSEGGLESSYPYFNLWSPPFRFQEQERLEVGRARVR